MANNQTKQTVLGKKISVLLGRSTEYLDSGELRITTHFDKPIHTWIRDGHDHVNVSVHGTTEVGFKLSFAAKNIVRHPLLGGFASLQNMLMWSIVRYHPDADNIRWVNGSQRIPVYMKLVDECDKIGCLQSAPVNKVAIAAAHIMDVLNSDAGLLQEFQNIDVPYDSYLISASGLRYRDDYAAPGWYLNTLDAIQKHIVFDNKPGFPDLGLFVKSGSAENIYDEILPAYQLDAIIQQREAGKKEIPPKKKAPKQKRPVADLEEDDKNLLSSALSELDKRAAAIEVGTTAQDPAPLSDEEAKAFAEVFVDSQPALQKSSLPSLPLQSFGEVQTIVNTTVEGLLTEGQTVEKVYTELSQQPQ